MKWMCVLGCLLAFPGLAKTIEVKSDESIQTAIDAAEAGDTIRIAYGIYHEALHVDKPRLKLVGVSREGKMPVLDGRGELNDGVIASGSGFHVENLHFRHYRANGVTTQGANNVVIRRLLVEDTGIYGIYPTHGKNILVEDNIAWGIADAAIYIGMCTNVDVRRNEVFGNVAGIEFENSQHGLVENNMVYNNTGGILAFVLPGLPKKTGGHITIRHNYIIDNNHRNFAEAGAIVGSVPPGTGLVILAYDDVLIEDNIIRDNSFAGVIVADLSVMGKAQTDPKVEPNPDRVTIGYNLFHRNGEKSLRDYVLWFHFLAKNLLGGVSPEGSNELLPPGADIAGTGKGTDNCLLAGLGAKMIDVDHFVPCPADRVAKAVTSTIAQNDPGEEEIVDPGEHTFNVICAGCHASGYRLIGPAVEEIAAKYAGRPEGIAQYAMEPKKVRSDYPVMPSQRHLGSAKLKAAAAHILKLGREAKK